MAQIVFWDQIGRNVEAYVDNIMVKSKGESDLVADLRETFDNIRRSGLRLNPEKCTFGVRSGKLLGYLVSHRGIEANPEKIQAIQEMEPPTTVREVQCLNGRVAALARFFARSAERSLPFFRALRGADTF